MSTKKMLIDTTHPEETRVVVLSGKLLEDFDVEVESRRQLKGNIYLAKVIRVEPSLQAAFVDYGGNRHGFLSFNEIHPDYYQIPVADREALVAEHDAAEKADVYSEPGDEGDAQSGGVETVGGDEIEEEAVRRRRSSMRRYKIQEVIKRRQILLVQVVKEERGNKGAALTTYLSLAGRYCVLMPNTARGGGISRKIANGPDRKKLKSILGELGIPDGMAVIARTAGSKRSKTEIKRDYEYLMRLWDTIRELTLSSTAPSFIHEEANLIKRTIRDLYNNDIEEIVVDGDEGYRAAKSFMKLMIPSHAKKVQPYRDESLPLFQRYQVESQLDTIHNPTVQLNSGGYIVICPTEALVAIDVNSGRSTKERNIEETALKTNLEAVDEIARQVRLRDLAGLIVIDFIDMEVSRNNSKVERRLKDAMRNDRARIQLGRISPFGLLEFSRQRLRPSLMETSSEPCPYCDGSGVRRSTDSAALFVLRTIEEEVTKGRAEEIIVHTSTAVALYILNHKRDSLADIETRNSVSISLTGDDSLIPPECRIERTKQKDGAPAEPRTGTAGKDERSTDEKEDGRRRRRSRRPKRSGDERESATEDQGPRDTLETEEKTAANDGDNEQPSGRRRRRGRRGGRRRSRKPAEATATMPPADSPISASVPAPGTLLEGPSEAASLDAPPKPDQPETVMIVSPNGGIESEAVAGKEASDKPAAKKPSRRKSPAKDSTPRRKPRAKTEKAESATVEAETTEEAKAEETTKPKPARKPRAAAKKKDKKETAVKETNKKTPKETKDKKAAATNDSKTTVTDIGDKTAPTASGKPRKGWWQRLSE